MFSIYKYIPDIKVVFNISMYKLTNFHQSPNKHKYS